MARIGLTKGRVLGALGLSLLLFLPPSASAESWKKAYLKGLDLMDAEQWQQAVEAFDRAIQANPREGKGVRLYGMRYGYFPHRDKGIALYHLGQWAAAIRALEESLKQGSTKEAVRHLELARKRQPMVALPRVFRGTWWDHYERGLLYSEQGVWTSAIEDFRTALKGRGQGGRFVRTYGVHFMEYFPLREMGVAFYHDGQYQAAATTLERSLATNPTAKASYYFNLARAALLKRSSVDGGPPRVKIEAPRDGLVTNLARLEVRGTAESGNFVASVEINGEPLLVETALEQLPFALTVPLAPGQNVIEVVARDLVAKESTTAVSVVVDREGPVVEIEGVGLVGGGRIQFQGAVYDNVRLGSLVINGRQVALSGAVESRFSEELPSTARAVLIEAKDAIGNTTRARIPIPAQLRQHGARPWFHVVPAAWPPVVPVIFHTREPLTLEVEDVPDEVQQETLSISWIATAASSLAAVEINGEAKTVRKAAAGKPQIFSHILTLGEGKNVVTITVSDTEGRTLSKTVEVTRKVEEVDQIGSRLSVAVIPFQHKGKASELYEGAYEALVDALVNQRRFKIVSRVQLENILKELKLSRTELVDQATAVRVGKLAAAEAIVVGVVNETARTAEVYVRLVNTETTAVLAAKDIFDPAKAPGNVRQKMREMATKIQQAYPLVEGRVITVRNRRVAIGMGTEKGVRSDMRVILYMEGEPLVDPDTKVVLDRSVDLLWEGLVKEVRPRVAFCTPKTEEVEELKRYMAQGERLKVITK